MKYRLAAALAGITIATAGVIAAPAPAFAASGPLCNGTGCLNKDPVAEHCSADAYAVSTANIAAISSNIKNNGNNKTGFGYLYLMYSPGCNANWAEFDSYPSGYTFILEAWNNAEGDAGPVDVWKSAGDKVAWTNMVNGSGNADVGVCEFNSSLSAVGTAYLMQDGGDRFSCQNGGSDLIDY